MPQSQLAKVALFEMRFSIFSLASALLDPPVLDRGKGGPGEAAASGDSAGGVVRAGPRVKLSAAAAG